MPDVKSSLAADPASGERRRGQCVRAQGGEREAPTGASAFASLLKVSHFRHSRHIFARRSAQRRLSPTLLDLFRIDSDIFFLRIGSVRVLPILFRDPVLIGGSRTRTRRLKLRYLVLFHANGASAAAHNGRCYRRCHSYADD